MNRYTAEEREALCDAYEVAVHKNDYVSNGDHWRARGMYRIDGVARFATATGHTRTDTIDAVLGAIDRAQFKASREPKQGAAETPQWQPIETAPKNGTYILLAGPSGYVTTPLRAEIGHWDAQRTYSPWRTHSNDPFTDGGEAPTLWMPLP